VGNKAYLINGGRVTVDGAHGGLFATWFGENAYLNGALGGGFNYFDTRRASVGGDAVGSTDGYELDALLGGGYDFKCDRLTLGPVVSLQYTYVNIAAFTETSSLAPLHIENNDNNSLHSVAGGRVAYDFPVHATVIRPELQLGWGHEFLDTDHTIDSQFATGAGSIFSVHSPTVGRDYLAVGASVTVQWSDRLVTYISYSGDLAGQNTSVHTFNVGLGLSL
jgi:outer membrane autotransporter protein